MRFKEYLEESKGSFLDNKKVPKDGQMVYAVVGFDQKIVKGKVLKTSNIDKKGIANTYLDIDVNGKTYHVDISQIFDHKPKKVKVKDEYGEVTIWEDLNESSLTRLLRHSKDGTFAMITAYRNQYDKEQNISRNRKLRGELNQNKMGVHQLVGHWEECIDPDIPYEKCPKDKKKDVIERSYFVPKRKDMTDDEFEKIILSLVKKFDQDAALLYRDGTAYVLEKSGKKFSVGKTLEIGKMAQAYSQHVKKLKIPFTFD